MDIAAIAPLLTNLFPAVAIAAPTPNTWQVELPDARLLILLSEDQAWLRLLLPLAPQPEAEPYLESLLALNFDLTQEVRFALHQEVLWGVFQFNRLTLTLEDLEAAIARLLKLAQSWRDEAFRYQSDRQLRQIIAAAKAQGQTLNQTLQNLDRMYSEGMLGDLGPTEEVKDRILLAWQTRLSLLWEQVNP
ncbi:hypothetical protein PN441_02215 [Spirulina major CS-329]|uniref:hypothetical protein n=1 Tax=Spirulina TaxID=1154 RepID=UPI00232E7794|nr:MULTISPECIES: hypothetical protein [Spirulina]MDB9494531.1 hypothetical protein [Spirulina subsalsa CS-330]MDB9501871.1 hypothetical protein [Spirulina major CS-329]